MIPTSIDGTDITGATIDGTDVQEITVDGQTVFSAGPVIPDEGDLHARYDWTQASGTSSVSDLSGNGFDLTGSYSGPNASINGNQAGDFDGIDDELNVSFAAENTPVSIFLAVRWDVVQTGLGNTEYIYDSADSSFEIFLNNNGNGDWQFGGSSFFNDGAADTNPAIVSAIYRSSGNTSELFINGSSSADASGDIGSNSLQGFNLGDDGSSTGRYGEFSIGEILIYPQDKSSIRSDVENYLSTKWGITI